MEQPNFAQQIRHRKKLFSIPEVAEEDGDYSELLHRQGLGVPRKMRGTLARECRPIRTYNQDHPQVFWHPAKQRILEDSEDRGYKYSEDRGYKYSEDRGYKYWEDRVYKYSEDRGYKYSRSSTRSPDSGLDCGSEEEELRFSFRNARDPVSANAAPPSCCADGRTCSCQKTPRPLLERRRTLTRQSSVEEDFDVPSFLDARNEEVKPTYFDWKCQPQRCHRADNFSRDDFQGGWKSRFKGDGVRAPSFPHVKSSYREPGDPLVC